MCFHLAGISCGVQDASATQYVHLGVEISGLFVFFSLPGLSPAPALY